MILGIVGGLVALVVIIGLIIGSVTGNKSAGSTIEPGSGTPTAQGPPQQDPSTEPSSPSSDKPTSPTSDKPSDEPTDSGGSSGAPISLAEGCSVTPASGWDVKQQKKGVVVLTNSEAGGSLNAQCVDAGGKVDPTQVLDTWMDQISADGSNVQKKDPESTDTGSSKLTAASQTMQYVESSSQGTATVAVTAVVAVRDDGVTSIETIWYTEDSDLDTLNSDFSAMVASVWKSML